MPASPTPKSKRLLISALIAALLFAPLLVLFTRPKPKPPTLEDRILQVIQTNGVASYYNPKLISHDVKKQEAGNAWGPVVFTVPRSEFFRDQTLTGQIQVTGTVGIDPPPPPPTPWEWLQQQIGLRPTVYAKSVSSEMLIVDFPDFAKTYKSVKARHGQEHPRNLVAELDYAINSLAHTQQESKGMAQALLLRAHLLLDENKTQEAAETLTKAQPAIQKNPELQAEYKTLKSQIP